MNLGKAWVLVWAILVACALPAPGANKKRVLLLAQGPDGHPRRTHEYRAGVKVLAQCLQRAPQVEVTTVSADGEWLAGPELIRKADCVVLFLSEGAKWIHAEPRRLEAFAEHAAGGGGLVTIHWAMGTREAKNIDGYLKLFGGCHGGEDRRYKVVDTTVKVTPNHPVTVGLQDFKIHEEFYFKLKFVDADRSIQSILKAEIEGKQETVAWAWNRVDGGRSFGFSGGHFHENWKRLEYRRLIGQAVLWTSKIEPPAAGLNVDVPDEIYKLPPPKSPTPRADP
ncbi:MAG: ThuA domain-containing protein [Pirellulaceae bacterium]|jgi:type 1 glutamine amidotransferase|nr:ThuA domain-containing protein [Pirellulaceae bacterium]MDP7019048.1 ThuA domain-containing protein [Pirellulaceae bacterium]